MIVELNRDNYEKTIMESTVPVIVDFWAPWCGPCKMLGPVLEEISREYDGKVLIGKVNIDDNQDLAMMFEVMSVPTMLLYKDHQYAGRNIGFIPKQAILQFAGIE